jgi:ethanolamine transporter EutH
MYYIVNPKYFSLEIYIILKNIIYIIFIKIFLINFLIKKKENKFLAGFYKFKK